MKKETIKEILQATVIIIYFIATASLLWLLLTEATKTPSQPEIVQPTPSEELVELYAVKSETIREITAYNVGDPNQCWGDPCISANGENICESLASGLNRCAANFVPFGTELQIIPETGWEFNCVVVDRMNSRYKNRVDIAMKLSDYDKAISFGLQKLLVRVVEKQ